MGWKQDNSTVMNRHYVPAAGHAPSVGFLRTGLALVTFSLAGGGLTAVYNSFAQYAREETQEILANVPRSAYQSLHFASVLEYKIQTLPSEAKELRGSLVRKKHVQRRNYFESIAELATFISDYR